MKKSILIKIIIAVIVLIAVAVGIWIYLDSEENKKLDATSVTLKENLEIEFGKPAKVSDFIQNLNGELVQDKEINTEELGDIKVDFEYINIKNRKREYSFNIKTVDKTAPKILCGSSLTVKTGYKKNLTDVLLSGDDLDDTPKREMVGEYDVNKQGDYNLTYVVTDASRKFYK